MSVLVELLPALYMGRMKRFLPFTKKDPSVAVIRLQGTIAAGGRGSLNDTGLAPLIEKAFKRKGLAAVALSINSPGGSPVQSSLIAARIRRLADENGVEVHAFVEDVAASGGYWLATAADKIWVDGNSIVGSIGVIFSSFGFSDFISRYGIERRLHTAGESKSLLDPFLPEKSEDVERLKVLQGHIHEEFKTHVRTRRGDRIARDDLFTGDVWVGQQSIEVGLADGLGHLVPKMKELYGDKVQFKVFQQRRSFAGLLSRSMTSAVIEDVEERAHFARFGL